MYEDERKYEEGERKVVERCENFHTVKLMDEAAIEHYSTIFEPSQNLSLIKGFLISLGKFQKLCVSRELNQVEIDQMESHINETWKYISKMAGGLNATLKLHALLEHTIPFVQLHRSLGLTSEQGIEALHAASNKLLLRFVSVRDPSEKYILCFRSLSYMNFINHSN
uniref:Uncharacterized protein n=1 Tax=Caenorhabditis japonica TaxID=281687 RepID=A0A8R1HVX5_CAEJA